MVRARHGGTVPVRLHMPRRDRGRTAHLSHEAKPTPAQNPDGTSNLLPCLGRRGFPCYPRPRTARGPCFLGQADDRTSGRPIPAPAEAGTGNSSYAAAPPSAPPPMLDGSSFSPGPMVELIDTFFT